MRLPSPETVSRLLLRAAMTAATAVFLLQLASDPDFFWHLKTGEWIWQHRALPAADPFNYRNEAVNDPTLSFTLRAYWLPQLLYHLVHALFGMPGILGLKLLLALLIVLALERLRRGDRVVHTALVLAALPLLFRVYHLDRPQAFSFLFFAALLALLERERRSPPAPSGWRSYVPLPLLMLLWANTHGGHVLGQITIALFLALEGVKFAHPRLQPLERDRYRRLLLAGSLGLAASLLNPNLHHALEVSLAPPPTWVGNPEYASSVTIFETEPLIAIFWVALALAAISCLRSLARPDITWLALLAGTGYQGFFHIRYVPFFIVASLPAIGSLLSAGQPRRLRHLLAAGSIALVALSVREGLPDRERLQRALRVDEYVYPVRAADFVIAAAPQGNLYNTYLWGGYLLWRLAPERRVFADGRYQTAQDAFRAFTVNLAFANPGAPPLWKKILQEHGVGYAIIPRVDAFGGVVFDGVANLRAALLAAPEWVPIFADDISLVFVLDAPQHLDLVRRHGIPKDRIALGM